MRSSNRLVIHCLTALLLVSVMTTASHAAAPPARRDPPEVRGLWVDAFHAGIRTAAEADQLVKEAKRARLNVLFVQVRRRGDALYTKGFEPPVEDPNYDPAFDALAYIVSVAHRERIKVHAWINAMPVWRDDVLPKAARHVFNTHGPGASPGEMWLTSGPDGVQKFPVGYFLDPGHPGVQDYLAKVYANVVREYAVDGIHFDYIRYPETDTTLERGAAVGYNATSLARFQRATGRTDVPAPGDETWIQWRRRQVTSIVRRVFLEAKAIRPTIVVSAAVIPWGAPPIGEDDFADAAPMQRVFQDWHGWLKDGLIDLAVPMNYARETDERVRAWFDGWVTWEREHAHGRQIAVGLGAYRNTPGDSLAQVARVRQQHGQSRLAGVSFFSYAVPTLPAVPTSENGTPLTPQELPDPGVDRLAFLADGVPPTLPAFRQPVALPRMPWIDTPTRGWLSGVVRVAAQASADDRVVTVRRNGTARPAVSVRTDANGFFGVTDVAPGSYVVSLADGTVQAATTVRVVAGRVASATLDTTRPPKRRSSN